jgi:glycosyltransferase involved in cell wall biosynthesis
VTSLAVCVPWREPGPGIRTRLWDYARHRLELSGVSYYVASDGRAQGEPFNISAARNNAIRQSTEDIVYVMDADTIYQPRAVEAALDKVVSQNFPWVPVYQRNGVFSFYQTEAIFRGELDPLSVMPEMTEVYCTSPLMIRREVWEDSGGYDEGFSGWGAEDGVYRSVLLTLHPIPLEASPPADSMNLCLCHEWAREPMTWDANKHRADQYDLTYAKGPEAVRQYVEDLKLKQSIL